MSPSPIVAYLDSLRQYDHVPGPTGTITIGRTTYSAGTFVTPPRPISPGCRAYAEGERFTATTERIAVISESLPPASRRPVVYVDQHGTEWYVSGWTTKQEINVFWLDKVSPTRSNATFVPSMGRAPSCGTRAGTLTSPSTPPTGARLWD